MSEFKEIDEHGIERNYHQDPQASWQRYLRENGGIPTQTINVSQQEDGSYIARSGSLSAIGDSDFNAAGNLQRILAERNAHMEF